MNRSAILCFGAESINDIKIQYSNKKNQSYGTIFSDDFGHQSYSGIEKCVIRFMLLVWLPLIVQGLLGLHCNVITGWKGLTIFLSWHMMLLCDHLLLSRWVLLLLVLWILVLMWRSWSLCLKSDKKFFIFECGSCPYSANEQIIRYNTVSTKR